MNDIMVRISLDDLRKLIPRLEDRDLLVHEYSNGYVSTKGTVRLSVNDEQILIWTVTR